MADVQTDAFYEPPRAAPLASPMRTSFRAETLDALRRKFAAGPERFACWAVSAEEAALSAGDFAGAVELSVLDEAEVANALGAERTVDGRYAYLASMAVRRSAQRKGVGVALLDCVEGQAQEWGFDHITLHVYEDNLPARALYEKRGYECLVDTKADWWRPALGLRRRLLLLKTLA